MTGEWRRPSTCEASSCPEWRTLSDGTVKLRSTSQPDAAIVFTPGELEDLVAAYQRGEVVTA